jgi:hypothetical protein
VKATLATCVPNAPKGVVMRLGAAFVRFDNRSHASAAYHGLRQAMGADVGVAPFVASPIASLTRVYGNDEGLAGTILPPMAVMEVVQVASAARSAAAASGPAPGPEVLSWTVTAGDTCVPLVVAPASMTAATAGGAGAGAGAVSSVAMVPQLAVVLPVALGKRSAACAGLCATALPESCPSSPVSSDDSVYTSSGDDASPYAVGAELDCTASWEYDEEEFEVEEEDVAVAQAPRKRVTTAAAWSCAEVVLPVTVDLSRYGVRCGTLPGEAPAPVPAPVCASSPLTFEDALHAFEVEGGWVEEDAFGCELDGALWASEAASVAGGVAAAAPAPASVADLLQGPAPATSSGAACAALPSPLQLQRRPSAECEWDFAGLSPQLGVSLPADVEHFLSTMDGCSGDLVM